MTRIFPCSVNSIPFSPSVSMRRNIDAMYNWGQSSYINGLLKWQTKLQYLNKRLFGDYITLQFKTQANSTPTFEPDVNRWAYNNFATLKVFSSKPDPITGFPIPNKEITAFTNALNPPLVGGASPVTLGSPFLGIQQPAYDIYTNPIDLTTLPLVSYCWQFRFQDYLSADTDSGIYFLVFANSDGVTTETWYSEPILMYGTDALSTFPQTLEFEAINVTNKSDIIIDNWFNINNPPNNQCVFTTRIEGDILDYDPKSVYMGMLQQNWLPNETYTHSWKTWQLNVGNSHDGAGVPRTMFDIITKFMELDYILINNQYYSYDIANGGSASPAAAWKMQKPRVHGLLRGSLPIRYKFDGASQFYVGSPITRPRVFDDTFDGVFA